MAQTYYEILGVPENATSSEIEVAFKSKAREVHPDKVPPGNTYLRKIAAEAFKDLSEARSVLLSPTERRKYDSELAYMRGSETFYTEPQSSPPPPPPPPPPPSAAPRSQQSSQPTAAPPSPPVHRYSFWQPINTKFAIGSLMTMAVGCVLLASGIAGSEQAANLGLALIISGFALLCWRHGSRPTTDAAYLGGSVMLFIVAIIFSYADLQSTPSATKLPAPTRIPTPVATVTPKALPDFIPCRTPDGKPCLDRGQASSRANAASKHVQRASSGPRAETDPILEAIKGAGDHASDASSTIDAKSQMRPETGTNYVTKTWKNLKDGQIYRTHSKAGTLYIETADNYQNRTGDFISCEFQTAVSPGLSWTWTGFCWVRNPKDQSSYRSTATLATFSENRIEGSTTYIPRFIMIPAETAAADPSQNSVISEAQQPQSRVVPPSGTARTLTPGPSGSPAAFPTAHRTPDLNSLTSSERESIESACAYDKQINGPAAYNRCLKTQLNLLGTAPELPDLSRLGGSERESIESACAYDKQINGPAAYNKCVQRQLTLLGATPRRPDLSRLSNSERESIESACAYDKQINGPAAYNRCLLYQLRLLSDSR